MFDSHMYHCLELNEETGRWTFVNSTHSHESAAAFVLSSVDINRPDHTRLVVGPAEYQDSPSEEVFDDGYYRLRPYCASNGGKVKQPWPARITAVMIPLIEEGFARHAAAELAALEKRREREEWEAKDREVIRRDRAEMDAEQRGASDSADDANPTAP